MQPLGMQPRRRHDDEIEAFNKFQKIGQTEDAIAFLGAMLAERKQSRQPSPSGAIRRISQNVGRFIGKHQPCANRQFE